MAGGSGVVSVFERMKDINPSMLVLGTVWIGMAAPYIISLFPMGERLVQRFELWLKPGAKPGVKTIAGMSRLRRVIFILFCGLYAAVGFGSAFHHSISSPGVLFFMIGLPALFLWLGREDWWFKSGHGPNA